MKIGRTANLACLLRVIVAWPALALQLILIIGKMTDEDSTATEAVWRYLGFFTILRILFVGLVSSALAVTDQGISTGARTRLAAVAAIVMVGIVYSVALRHVWQPEGWQAVADHAPRDVVPPLFLIAWLLSPHGHLTWKDVPLVAAPPTAYVSYALVRGQFDSWYAYWFLNPGALTHPAVPDKLRRPAHGLSGVGHVACSNRPLV